MLCLASGAREPRGLDCRSAVQRPQDCGEVIPAVGSTKNDICHRTYCTVAYTFLCLHNKRYRCSDWTYPFQKIMGPIVPYRKLTKVAVKYFGDIYSLPKNILHLLSQFSRGDLVLGTCFFFWLRTIICK